MSDFIGKINAVEPAYQLPDGGNTGGANSDEVDLSVLLGFEEVNGDGEPDLIVELIDLYLADVPQQLSAMREAVSKADENSLKRAAHTLKGSSANLGVNAVAALCQTIETAGSNRSFDAARNLIDSLEKTFERVRQIFLTERKKRV